MGNRSSFFFSFHFFFTFTWCERSWQVFLAQFFCEGAYNGVLVHHQRHRLQFRCRMGYQGVQLEHVGKRRQVACCNLIFWRRRSFYTMQRTQPNNSYSVQSQLIQGTKHGAIALFYPGLVCPGLESQPGQVQYNNQTHPMFPLLSKIQCSECILPRFPICLLVRKE